ncbi:hypothetical protein ACKKBG_A15155 [Auxenochlorella protothecoides x Auxenochlorella symbiontica]
MRPLFTSMVSALFTLMLAASAVGMTVDGHVELPIRYESRSLQQAICPPPTFPTFIYNGYLESYYVPPNLSYWESFPPYINVVYLAFFKPDSTYTPESMSLEGTGLNFEGTSAGEFGARVQALRSTGTKVMISVGGASTPDNTVSWNSSMLLRRPPLSRTSDWMGLTLISSRTSQVRGAQDSGS